MKRLYALDPLLHEPLLDSYKDDQGLAARMAELLKKDIECPYSISVNGTWGSGKTILMKAVHIALRDDHYPTLWFNPWEYTRSHNVVLALLQCMARAFRNTFYLRDLGVFGATLLGGGIDMMAQVLTGSALSYDNLSKIAKDIATELQPVWSDFEDPVKRLKTDFSRLTNEVAKKHDHKPLVVFLDDLDRCLPDDTIAILEALKSLFVVPQARVIFMSAIDTSVARRFIVDRYKGLNEEFALNYFKKIFNLTIDVPHFTEDSLRRFIHQHVERLYTATALNTKQAELLVDAVSQLALQAGLNSYRDVSNVLNNYYVRTASRRIPLTEEALLAVLTLRERWFGYYETLGIEARKARRAGNTTLGDVVKNGIDSKHAADAQLAGFVNTALPWDALISPLLDYSIL